MRLLWRAVSLTDSTSTKESEWSEVLWDSGELPAGRASSVISSGSTPFTGGGHLKMSGFVVIAASPKQNDGSLKKKNQMFRQTSITKQFTREEEEGKEE